jgi:hypothetical protein
VKAQRTTTTVGGGIKNMQQPIGANSASRCQAAPRRLTSSLPIWLDTVAVLGTGFRFCF